MLDVICTILAFLIFKIHMMFFLPIFVMNTLFLKILHDLDNDNHPRFIHLIINLLGTMVLLSELILNQVIVIRVFVL